MNTRSGASSASASFVGPGMNPPSRATSRGEIPSRFQIAEEYLAEHPVRTGVFLVLVARAPATVWKVSRSRAGVIHHLEKTRQFVNHYSLQIMDPTWGHVTIKI